MQLTWALTNLCRFESNPFASGSITITVKWASSNRHIQSITWRQTSRVRQVLLYKPNSKLLTSYTKGTFSDLKAMYLFSDGEMPLISDSIQVVLTDNTLCNECRSQLILDSRSYSVSYTLQKLKEEILELVSYLIYSWAEHSRESGINFFTAFHIQVV